ncbi:MAG: hypothetical protein KAS32_04230 [Candidatus Peribacteraceae bacterium]|nr:hypothetical protein [Candidatus Peribacteraceae bacterium]
MYNQYQFRGQPCPDNCYFEDDPQCDCGGNENVQTCPCDGCSQYREHFEMEAK